jgi:hypothetical protein
MGVRDLFFRLTATDETGAAFASVKKHLQGIDDAVSRAQDRLTRWGGGLTKIGLGISAVMAPAILAFSGSVQAFDDSAKAAAKVEQAIKSTGAAAGFTAGQLFEVAAGLQDITRFDGDDILNKVTAQLLTFTNIAGSEFLRAQTAALDLATVLDGDLQSASITLGKALNDPVKGLSALGKAGIQFSAQQKEVIKSLAEAGDLAGAQQIILAELERQYGGQAEVAARAGVGALDQLRNAWGDVVETVGGVIASILPPVVDFFRTMVDGFLGLPEPMQRFIVVAGLVAAALGPLAIAAGAAAIALGALSGPVLIAGAAITGLIALVAALWPEQENLATATDNAVLALGDEITQGKLLATALNGNISMSVSAAQTKLQEAIARRENVAAIIAEQRALTLQSGEYQQVLTDIQLRRDQLNTIGFPARDIVVAERRDAYNAVENALVGLVNKQQELLETDKRLSDQLATETENIAKLEAGIAGASDEVVKFGEAVVTPIEPTERLGAAAAGAAPGLKELEDQALDTADAFDGLGDDISSTLGDMVGDASGNMSSLSDVLLSIGQNMRDRLLKLVFDPIGQAAEELFRSILSGAGGGGGGLFGGIGKAIGGFFGSIFGGLPGFDTGGEFIAGGRNGVDRNVAAFRVSAGEKVSITRPGQSSGGSPVYVTIQTPNPAAFKASQGQTSAMIARAVARGSRNT